MIHPDTELRFIDEEIGHGVFATQPIPRGTLTWVLDPFDQLLSATRVAALAPAQRAVVEEYAFVDPQGQYVLCWDHARYVNHACQPTSRGVGPSVEIAVRDIEPGEQLTSDYAELNITATFRCRCGQPRCRDFVRADDLLLHWQEWDDLVVAALPFLSQVAQPLWHFVQGDALLESLLRGQATAPSRLRYYRAQQSALPPDTGDMVRERLWRLPSADAV